MTKSNILNVVLGCALLCAVGKIAFGSSANSGNAIDAIMNRTSVRAYDSSRALSAQQQETLLRAGMAAPSAVNKQPWHFVAVDNRDVLKALADANPNARAVAQAPFAIVVCGDMNKALEGKNREYWIQDASAATENILIAATAMGLGSLWTGTYPNPDRCQAVSKVLNLPSHIVPLCTIAIGYASGDVSPKDKWDEANVSHNFFGNGPVAQAPAPAPAKKAFREVDVCKDFRTNPFTFFKGNGLLLCAGREGDVAEMTIGWGAMGNIWERNDAVLTVYVSSSRNTFGYMEKAEHFTVMEFPEDKADVLQYMGSHSGRDGNKAEVCGLTTLYTENGTPYFAEASAVYECEMIYHAPFDPKGFGTMSKDFYAQYESGMHTMYMGKIVKALRK